MFVYELLTVVSLSALMSALIVFAAQKKQWFLSQHDLSGVQKFHHRPTPHVGGLAIYCSFVIGCAIMSNIQDEILPILLVVTPVFLIGLLEDYSARISPAIRLVVIFLSIGLCFYFLKIGIYSLDFYWADILLEYTFVCLPFTLLVIGGAVNAHNVIDGFNGLLSGYALMVLVALSIVANSLGDTMILQSCLLLGASIFGFFLLNFPKGKIFMGDGGSYFIGFIVSIIGLLFAERHDEVSNWFILLLLIYPMYELLFSSYRRKFYKGASVTEADAEHLHSLIYLALRFSSRFDLEPSACNSITSLFLWTFSLVSLIPATIWYDDQIVLINFTVLFMIAYTVIYQCILRPKFGREKIAKTE